MIDFDHQREIQRQARLLAGGAYLDDDQGRQRLQHALGGLPEGDRAIYAAAFLGRLGAIEQSVAVQRRRHGPPRAGCIGRHREPIDERG